MSEISIKLDIPKIRRVQTRYQIPGVVRAQGPDRTILGGFSWALSAQDVPAVAGGQSWTIPALSRARYWQGTDSQVTLDPKHGYMVFAVPGDPQLYFIEWENWAAVPAGQDVCKVASVDAVFDLHPRLLQVQALFGNLIALLAGFPGVTEQYGTPDNPDIIDSYGSNPNMGDAFDAGPSFNATSAMKVATDGTNSVAIDGSGVAKYLAPGTGSSYTAIAFPLELSTANRTYVLGVAWSAGTWWALVKQVNEMSMSTGFVVSVDIGIFILTATTIDPTDDTSWTLYRTIQANSGSATGIANLLGSNELQARITQGIFTSGVLTDIGLPEMIVRFADGTGVVTTEGQSVTIPGGVSGTFTVGVNADGSFTVNGGTVTVATIVVGDRPSTWTPVFDSLHFYNGGDIQPAGTGSTITLVDPITASTPDGSIGGVELSNGFIASEGATAGLTVSGIPTGALYALLLFYYTQYTLVADGFPTNTDVRQLGISGMDNGTIPFIGDPLASALSAGGSLGTGNLALSTINDHGSAFGGGEGFQNANYYCFPTITTTYTSITPLEPGALGIGAGGACLVSEETLPASETTISGIIWDYLTGASTTTPLSGPDSDTVSAALGVYTDRLSLLLARFNGDANVPMWAGGVIIDATGTIDDSTIWLGVCDDGSDGLYAVDGASGDLMHRAGDASHGWDLVASALTSTSDTILLMRVLADTSVLCAHGSSGACQVDTVLSGTITAGTPFAFPTDEYNKAVSSGGTGGGFELESAYATAAGGGS